MKKIYLLIMLFLSISIPCSAWDDDGLHVVILTGQSQMSNLPMVYFTDAIDEEIGTNHTVMIKYAVGGMPIAQWDQTQVGIIYNTLMTLVNNALAEYEGRDITSITFVWAQGATDAMYNRMDTYQQSFDQLLYQLRRDLDWQDIRLVIARTVDFNLTEPFLELRAIQEHIGDTYQNATWINVDDLNGVYNTMHLPYASYNILARRYADYIIEAICIERNN